MSRRTLEAEILKEARIVTGNKKLKQNDIMEWCTTKCESVEGEIPYFLPTLRIYITVKREEKTK
jgi:hypothetical protein